MQLFTKAGIDSLFDSFERIRALVIGDVMVDEYIWGSVDRISPEAPVPVVAVKRRSSHLGGAANVALNLLGMGAETVLCSVVGNDTRGRELLRLMEESRLSTEAVIISSQRLTTTKFRVFGNNTQMLRVDEETTEQLSPDDASAFEALLSQKIENEHWDVIVFQDYDKGLIHRTLIDGVCDLARKRGIPVAVDPKRRHFRLYKGVSLFKPNLKELGEGMNTTIVSSADPGFQKAVRTLHLEQDIDTVLVTLSHEGVFVSQRGTGQQVPAYIRNVADVSGAGDTVISVAALALALGLTPLQMAALGNLAGGLVCEEVGVVPVDRIKLKQEALKNLC